MPENVQVKQHPDVQIENNVPDILPTGANYVIYYKPNLFIDGRYVLKFKLSLLIRRDTEPYPKYSYSRCMRFGFLPPNSRDAFNKTALYCYQTAVIEFNKSLDTVFGRDRFSDMRFISQDELQQLVDNALNPQVN